MSSVAKRRATSSWLAVALWIAASERPTFEGEARVGVPFAQQVLPYRVAGRVEVLHGEHAAFLRDHLRHGPRCCRRGDAEPFIS